jgi:DNA polymerase (family 10)
MSRKRVSNAAIARALREMALFLEMDEVAFKPQAYEKAAYAVTALDRPLAQIHAEGGIKALDGLPGIGKGIAERIAAMLETGSLADLEALRQKTPIDVLALTAIEGIGPKKARALWQSLGVCTVADLKRAAKQGRIRELPHFGQRSEQRILAAIAFFEEAAGRRPLGEALELARRIEAALAKVPGVVHASIAGSIRRHRETIGDVDMLAAAKAPEAVSKVFESLPEVQTVLAHGPTKTLVRLSNGMDADLRVIAPESFGAALLYFTGSKAHNVALRRLALKLGLKLNEYGLFRGTRVIASRTEEDVYRMLGLAWIPPEMREDNGEVEMAQQGKLPGVVQDDDIRGDLQVHTSWTDGSASIEAMACAARKLGREYIVITDHAHDLAMSSGLDERRLRAQIKEVRAVDHDLGGIRVLAGVEVNLRADGSLDLDDEVLAELDLVGAAVHSHFDLPRAQMTRRIIRALENPNVDVLFHPVGRALGRRRAIALDFEAVLEACVRTGTILEIDAQPERLDLPDALVRAAVEAGARLAIDSDAHTVDELRFIEAFGTGVARRGWAERKHVINTLPIDEMLRVLKGPGHVRARRKARRPS